MKNLVSIFITLCFAFISNAAVTLTDTEKNLVKYFNSISKADPVEITKYEEQNRLVIEYPHIIYVIESESIKKIYTLGDEDWMLTYEGNESLEYLINNFSLAYADVDKTNKNYVTIERMNGTESYTIYYYESYWDNASNSTHYVSGEGREIIGIGENYAFYQDGRETIIFRLVK
jgi:hypothetical protein